MWLLTSADAYKFAASKNGWSIEDIFVDDVSYDGDALISATDTEIFINQLEPVGGNEIDTEIYVNQLEPIGSNEILSDNTFLVETTNGTKFLRMSKSTIRPGSLLLHIRNKFLNDGQWISTKIDIR